YAGPRASLSRARGGAGRSLQARRLQLSRDRPRRRHHQAHRSRGECRVHRVARFGLTHVISKAVDDTEGLMAAATLAGPGPLIDAHAINPSVSSTAFEMT